MKKTAISTKINFKLEWKLLSMFSLIYIFARLGTYAPSEYHTFRIFARDIEIDTLQHWGIDYTSPVLPGLSFPMV